MPVAKGNTPWNAGTSKGWTDKRGRKSEDTRRFLESFALMREELKRERAVKTELLESLKALLERYVLAIGNEGIECLKARAAIAKATGEQPCPPPK